MNATRRVLALVENTFELLDCVEAQLFWMLTFAKEHNLGKERHDSIHHLITRTRLMLQDLANISRQFGVASDESLQGDKSDDNFTEPVFIIYSGC